MDTRYNHLGKAGEYPQSVFESKNNLNSYIPQIIMEALDTNGSKLQRCVSLIITNMTVRGKRLQQKKSVIVYFQFINTFKLGVLNDVFNLFITYL